MKKLTKIWAAVLLTALLFLSSCATTKRAAWHLDRAVKLDPTLKTERVDTIAIPEVSIDTFFTVDTIEIPADVDSILNALSDSCREEAKIIIKDPLIKYIKEREIIKDTLIYKQEIDNDSIHLVLFAEIWQDGTDIKLRIVLDDAIIKTTNTQVVDKPKDHNYLKLIIFSVIVAILLFIILKNLRKWLSL